MTPKKALQWVLFWIFASCLFDFCIYHFMGIEKASQFMNVYLVEKLLSFDNLFVFLLIFSHFNVPDRQRRKVLNYGLAGAVILRALFIGTGVTIVHQFAWILYGLGAVLIYSAYGMAFGGEDENNIGESKIIKFAKSLSIAPLVVWIVAIELSDIAFAIDSIPAALSISQDALIVYSANIFAILGLRSFYFLIQSVYGYLPQLKYGISLILAFIGAKMFAPLIGMEIPSLYSFGVVIVILMINISLVLVKAKKSKKLLFGK